MPAHQYNSIQEGLQAANDRIDKLSKRAVQDEAMLDCHLALIFALVTSHQDPKALREAWRRTSSIVIANASVHPGDDLALAEVARTTKEQVKMISDMLDNIMDGDETADD